MAHGWLGVMEREVRFFALLAEVEAIHETLLIILSSDET